MISTNNYGWVWKTILKRFSNFVEYKNEILPLVIAEAYNIGYSDAIDAGEEDGLSGRGIYDQKIGDNKECICGHSYYRHFDTYDEMRHIGCKYCNCYNFKEK